ncbi:hypothetical protein AB3331_04035 [Streptococcus sp. H49]|uniref:hypothetical protein n=1 Tax=Streptococcus huangxiaojuni TaxID=3237239 RepID=UPI0034A35B50
MKIGVDVLPDTLNPAKISTYASKSVMTLFFEPIYSDVENRGLCWVNRVNDYLWKIELKEKYWSNGERISTANIINTFVYYQKNNLSLSKELDVIENWQQYRKGAREFTDVGIIQENNNIFYIKTNCTCNLYNLFSNVEFTPLYLINNEFLQIGSGIFIPEENKEYRYNSNKFHQASIEESLELILVEDPDSVLFYSKNNIIDTTPTTLYKRDILDKLPGRIVKKSSSIHVSLLLNSNRSREERNKIKDIIENTEFENITSTFGYFFEEKNKKVNKRNSDKECVIELTFSATNYYPNYKNIKKISPLAHIKEIPLYVPPSDYVNDNSDVVYMLFRLNIESEYTLLLSYISYIDEDYIDDYIELLNLHNIFQLSEEEKKRINRFLEKHSNLIPIGNVEHQYKNNPENNLRLCIDANDCYYLDYGDEE